jgi:putative ABC transport system substrate-binding protein
MRRRAFILALGGAAAAWPLAGRAQQTTKVRRIGVLMNTDANDPHSQARIAAFLQRLQELGWTVGRDVQIDIRWGVGEPEGRRKHAAELVALTPDVILTPTAPIVTALQQATRTLPIVFAGAIDPVGAGLVESLAQPGGNATGFTLVEYGVSGKWLELLKEIAPGVRRAAVLRDPATATGIGQLAAVQAVAPSLRMEVVPLGVRDASEIERVVNTFAQEPNGGLIVGASRTGLAHRGLIIALAARHKLPAVYWERILCHRRRAHFLWA